MIDKFVDDFDNDDEECDDYKTTCEKAPNTTVMMYDKAAAAALPMLLTEEAKVTTMPCSGLTLKHCRHGNQVATVAFEAENAQVEVTAYRIAKAQLGQLDALYPEPQYTRIWVDYQMMGLWSKGCIYLGNKAYWEE